MSLARTCAPGITASGGESAPEFVTPTLGTPTAEVENTQANNLTKRITHTTTTGDCLLVGTTRSNGNPSPYFTSAEAFDDEEESAGSFTFIEDAGIGGSNNMMAGAFFIRGLAPGTYGFDVTFSRDVTRDFVLYAVDVTNMRQAGSPIGSAVQAHSTVAGDTITLSITPTDADSRIVAFQGINVGAAAIPATGVECTALDSDPTGNATDISGAIGQAVADDTDARDVGFDWAGASSNQATIVFELLPGEAS